MQPVVGDMLREWRKRRHLSQLELSARTGVSSRHLSYIETGRSRPSRQMILYLAEYLNVPLRERNALLLAAEYAPVYSHRDVVARNDSTAVLLEGVAQELLVPPVNASAPR